MKMKSQFPADAPWPVLDWDRATGEVVYAPGAIEAMADWIGIPIENITEELIGDITVRWYLSRRVQGHAPCPIMEQLLAVVCCQREAHRRGGFATHDVGRA